MSDSISLSLLALVVAAALFAVAKPTWLRVAFALVAGLAWAMTRDTNVYAALVVAPALLVALLVSNRSRRYLALALIGAVAIFALTVADAARGLRADEPIRDALSIRLEAHDRPAIAWMMRHGYGGVWANNTPAVYRSYLLHHPWTTLLQPLEDGPTQATFSSTTRYAALYTPSVEGYDGPHRTLIPGFARRVFWPRGPGWLGSELLVVFALAVAAAVVARRLPDARLAFAAVMLLAVYPQLLVVWHGSGQEIDRHALGPATQLRIAVLLVLVLAAEWAPAPTAAGPAAGPRAAGTRRARF